MKQQHLNRTRNKAVNGVEQRARQRNRAEWKRVTHQITTRHSKRRGKRRNNIEQAGAGRDKGTEIKQAFISLGPIPKWMTQSIHIFDLSNELIERISGKTTPREIRNVLVSHIAAWARKWMVDKSIALLSLLVQNKIGWGHEIGHLFPVLARPCLCVRMCVQVYLYIGKSKYDHNRWCAQMHLHFPLVVPPRNQTAPRWFWENEQQPTFCHVDIFDAPTRKHSHWRGQSL